MKYIVFIAIVMFIFASCDEYTVEQQPSEWIEYSNNPIISVSTNSLDLIWDNPCVIKEGEKYKMWLTGKTGVLNDYSKLYYATSTDGIAWEIDTNAVLEPGPPGNWDDLQVESPSVVKVDGTYHLYYCALKSGYSPRKFSIGHATSSDGKFWYKDPENPILTFHEDAEKWGYYSVSEPGVIYYNNKFYLYYATTKQREGYTDVRKYQQGIALAISSDGREFENYNSNGFDEIEILLTQTDYYPIDKYFVGYSTPFPLVDSLGTIHLFYDILQYQNKKDWQQVALTHATSRDGFYFGEKEYNFFTNNNEDWKNYEIRSPTVVLDSNVYKIWFAGNNEFFGQETFISGIGYATQNK